MNAVRILGHSHEHMGQASAYARMMGIRPPWSNSEESLNQQGHGLMVRITEPLLAMDDLHSLAIVIMRSKRIQIHGVSPIFGVEPDFERDNWSGRQDSNLRPPGPEPGAIPGFATPRLRCASSSYALADNICKQKAF